MADLGWTRYEEAEEAKHDAMCFNTAIRNGHTKEEAENCDAGSLGCPDCPFKQQKDERKVSNGINSNQPARP